MQIGAQFYTLREFCRTPEGIAECLKRIADIGYPTVQISGTCPFDPIWLKQELDKNGLTCVLTHTPPGELQKDPVQVARNHSAFGCDLVGLGYYGFKEEKGETVENFLQTYNPVVEALTRQGKIFMYHNHAHEFRRVGGKLILDHLVQAIPEMGSLWTLIGFRWAAAIRRSGWKNCPDEYPVST